MKLHELIKKLGMNYADSIKMLKELKLPYASPNMSLNSEQEEEVTDSLTDYKDRYYAAEAMKNNFTDARFLGIAQDKTTKKWKRYLLVINPSELAKVKHDLVELGESDTIYGAKVEINKKFMTNMISAPDDFT